MEDKNDTTAHFSTRGDALPQGKCEMHRRLEAKLQEIGPAKPNPFGAVKPEIHAADPDE
jgi:hypothetical protein